MFTHDDFSSLNILISEDKVVEIVDWETAEWYLLYWEYTNVCQVNSQSYFWHNEIDEFLISMSEKLMIKETYLKYFEDY